MLTLALHLTAGCSSGGYIGEHADGSVQGPRDLARPDLKGLDLAGASDLREPTDFAGASDAAMPPDFATSPDLAAPSDLATRPDLAAPPDLTPSGPITGGPCLGSVTGATALRIRWSDGGGRATLSYEVQGLPDRSRFKVGAYGYGTGYVPQFADPFLGPGGLQLDGSSFMDIEISTVGVHRINNVTLSIYGRSYSTGSSGSFNWMTFTGSGSTVTNYVSNTTPYRWYPADATTSINPDNGGILMRVKAGGSSGSLVVNRLEICIDAS